MYAWIGSDGGWKIGVVLIQVNDMCLMQHYHNPMIVEWVAADATIAYPSEQIPEPTT